MPDTKKPKKRRRTSVTVGHETVEIDGKQIRRAIKKYPSAPSLAKLDEKKKELKRIHGAGGPGALADIMFAPYARQWLAGRAGEISESTNRAYACYIENYLIPHLGDKQVQSILQSDIRAAMAKIDRAVNTKAGALIVLKAIFNQSIEDGIRQNNPAFTIRGKADHEPKRRALTEEEGAAVEQYIAEQSDNEARMLAIMYYCGCRRQEMMGLQWKHVDFKDKYIKICQQVICKKGGDEVSPNLKTKRSYRNIPLQPELAEFLLPLRGTPNAYVFQMAGRFYTVHEAYLLWLSAQDKCPALKDITPHYFRHNYATALYKAGVGPVEAAKYMGETVTVMLATYTHIEKELSMKHDAKVYGAFSRVAKTLPNASRETSE